MTFWAFSITTRMQTMYRAKLDVCQMRCWPLRDLIKLLACGEVGGVLLMMSHWLCRGRVWWRAGRMTAGTVVITGGILATVILLCIIAVLCYCRLQVYLCVCAHVCEWVFICALVLMSVSVLFFLKHCLLLYEPPHIDFLSNSSQCHLFLWILSLRQLSKLWQITLLAV